MLRKIINSLNPVYQARRVKEDSKSSYRAWIAATETYLYSAGAGLLLRNTCHPIIPFVSTFAVLTFLSKANQNREEIVKYIKPRIERTYGKIKTLRNYLGKKVKLIHDYSLI